MVYLPHMARRKLADRNVRSLFKLAGGKSYAITLPIETIREWGWRDRQKLRLTIDEKKKRIIVEDWTKNSKK
jgi:DNA primase